MVGKMKVDGLWLMVYGIVTEWDAKKIGHPERFPEMPEITCRNDGGGLMVSVLVVEPDVLMIVRVVGITVARRVGVVIVAEAASTQGFRIDRT